MHELKQRLGERPIGDTLKESAGLAEKLVGNSLRNKKGDEIALRPSKKTKT